MDYNKKIYEKHGLKITDEPVLTHHDEKITDVIERIYYAIQDKRNVTPQLISEIERYVALYPDVKSLKNHLYIAYTVTNQNEKAIALLHKTVEQHPDYIFAHLNLANQFYAEKNYQKAAALLRKPYDIRHFETEEYIHQSAFNSYYTTAIRIELALENLDEAEKIHRLLFDYDPKGKMLKEFGVLILGLRLKKQASHKAKNQRTAPIFSKPIQRTYLSDRNGEPVFNHIDIHRLYEYDVDDMPKSLIQKILALPRPTLIQDLERVFSDAVLRYKYFQTDGVDDNRFFLHALYLLTELKSYNSLPVILDFLRQDEAFMRFWMGDSLETHFHPTLYLLGNRQLGVLKNYVLEENNYPWFRLLACEVVAQVALKQPERRGEVVQWYRDIIRYHLDNAKNDNLIDTRFLSSMLGDLMHIGATELVDEVKELYATGWIDDKFCGNLEEILEDIHAPDMDFHNMPLPLNIDELYSKVYETRRIKSNRPIDPKIFEMLNDPYHNFLHKIMMETLLNNGRQNADDDADDYEEDWTPQLPVKRAESKVGRNDPCPCGSGKKYKKCHGQ
jgi:tetratricopeptide (TPR) repeat protein